MKKFPTLYRKTATGTIHIWSIEVVPSKEDSSALILTRFGQIGGAIQETSDIITEGKNIGQKNETTPYKQAIKEAESKWKLQKKKKGYVESIEAAKAGEVDGIVEGGIFPMLADKFSTKGDKIEYPAYLQPKLDGHRCIAIVKNGKCTLWSRTRKPINSIPHINAAVLALTGNQDAVLDGELYNHDYRNNFEELSSIIRKAEPAKDHNIVQYYIYDFPSAEGGFEQRYTLLKRLFEIGTVPRNLHLVETRLVGDEDEAMLGFEHFLSEGYEGAMLRNRAGEYLQHPTKRSPDLLKMKKFDDDEFEIVGVSEGRGKMAGKAIFTCRAKNGELFEAKMRGQLEKLKEIYQNASAYIGKQLTVQYFGLTSAKKVPRFPVAVRIREEE